MFDAAAEGPYSEVALTSGSGGSVASDDELGRAATALNGRTGPAAEPTYAMPDKSRKHLRPHRNDVNGEMGGVCGWGDKSEPGGREEEMRKAWGEVGVEEGMAGDDRERAGKWRS